jgi:hypothetical protein
MLHAPIEGGSHAGADADLAIYIASNRTAGRILKMEADYFENSWLVVCFGEFLFGREALRRMLPQKRGTFTAEPPLKLKTLMLSRHGIFGEIARP